MRRYAIAAMLALAACDMRPDHAEWQKQCVESHVDMIPISTYVPDGRGGGSVQMQWMYVATCDREAMVCVAGKDGSTTCG